MTIIENRMMNIVCSSLPEIAKHLKRIADSMEHKTCCICGKEFIGYGNNPSPVKENGTCCDECNQLVILERLRGIKDNTKKGE